MRAIAISRNQVHCFSLFFPLCSILNSQQVGHRDKVPGNLVQDLEWGCSSPQPFRSTSLCSESVTALRGVGPSPGGVVALTNARCCATSCFLGELESVPNLYSLTDVRWSQAAHQFLILVDGGVELPYEQRAAVLRSQRPLAQLCRNSHFSTDCRDMIFAISCTTCFGGTHERFSNCFASERARCGAGPSRNSGTAHGNSADCR